MTIRSRGASSTILFLGCASALALIAAGGCAGAPRERPLQTNPIESGPMTVEAARKFLEGRWTLISYEVFPPGKPGIKITGAGTLLYDDYGNLDMQIRVDDEAASEELRHAGVPLKEGRISSTGRTAIDMQAHTLTYLLEGQALVPTDPKGPLSYGQPRHWDVKGNVLTLTTKGDDGRAVAVGVWQKAP